MDLKALQELQAITWTSVDQDLQHHMTSLGPSALSKVVPGKFQLSGIITNTAYASVNWFR